MRAPIVMISGVSKCERHQLINDIADIIGKSEGWIIDHTMFSNIALTLRLALPESNLGILMQSLNKIEIGYDESGMTALKQAIAGYTGGDSEINLSINVTFVHTDPDLRGEVPAVPG